MGVSALAAASFTIDSQVLVAGELAAGASTVLVPVTPATFRPRRMDETERAFLARYLVG
jgi:acyl-CoA thioesterase FadM